MSETHEDLKLYGDNVNLNANASGKVIFTSTMLSGSSTSTGSFGQLQIDNTTLNTTADGRVGIGRVPVSWVHIDQTGSGTERGLYVYRNLSSGHTDGELLFVNNDNSGDDQPALRVKQDGSGDILVLDDDATRVMTVEDGGNVGIGTTSPGANYTL